MERVAFLVESSGERLGCLLNPDSLVVRRTAGVHPRLSAGGELSGAGFGDDPLLFTGGGRTELELDLLFDVNVAGSTIESQDVRDLTRPFWALSENGTSADTQSSPPRVRFVWGKSWNIPGIVTAVAERLEQFSADGMPQRSWLRMRLVRVTDTVQPVDAISGAGPIAGNLENAIADMPFSPEGLDGLPELLVPEQSISTHEISGGGAEGEVQAAERIDEITHRYYGAPWLWRLIALFNDIDDPLRLAPGTLLRIPPASTLTNGL